MLDFLSSVWRKLEHFCGRGAEASKGEIDNTKEAVIDKEGEFNRIKDISGGGILRKEKGLFILWGCVKEGSSGSCGG